MDTPAVPLPRDPRERAILDQLVMIRDHLLLLKQDRTNYIRAQDVMPLFDKTMEQVKELRIVRIETGDMDENRCKCFPNPAIYDKLTVSQWTKFWRVASNYYHSSTLPSVGTTRLLRRMP